MFRLGLITAVLSFLPFFDGSPRAHAQNAQGCQGCKMPKFTKASPDVNVAAIVDFAKKIGREDFFKNCGHAPARLFEGKIQVSSKSLWESRKAASQAPIQPGSPQMIEQVYTPKAPPLIKVFPVFLDTYSSNKPKAVIQKEKLQGSHHITPEMAQSVHFLSLRDPKEVSTQPTESPVKLSLLDAHDLEIYELISIPDAQLKNQNTPMVFIPNPNLSIADLFQALGPLAVELTDYSCPLPKKDQQNFCEKELPPYDPAEINPDEANTLNSKYKGDLWYPELLQNNKGFSYIVQYLTPKGKLVPERPINRFTASAYTFQNLFTKPPCPGWKVVRLITNFHNGPAPHANRLVKKQDGTSELKNSESMDADYLLKHHSEDLLKNFAPGAFVRLAACWSLNGENGIAMGDALKMLDPKRNPIARIEGNSGVCTTYSIDADSKMVPFRDGHFESWFNHRLAQSCAGSISAEEVRSCKPVRLSPKAYLCTTGKSQGCCYQGDSESKLYQRDYKCP
ncbi:MAG: hypothetical protein JNL01_13850 [Bdellovibrionales bacterium]|nr:hypothetical protein [Bdellovibrionales bacterium]